jgi:L,D-peptidoglycan transpeptidase YkuD (ErfK/YbiS/YcfS/YnhG family)
MTSARPFVAALVWTAIVAGSCASCASAPGPSRTQPRRATSRVATLSDRHARRSKRTTAPSATSLPTSPSTTTAVSPTSEATQPSSSPTAASPQSAASGSSQLVTVTAGAYADTVATFDAYQASGAGGWQLVFGPWQAYIGANGFAPPGQKTEGDGRTPSGTYGFGFFFGDLGNPGGFQFRFLQATTSDYWNDDPASSYYNQWVDVSTEGADAAGADPEPMYDEPYYDYGAVIDYNADPVVPGAGSAIFLHVSTADPTTGCVTLPVDELLEVLRWLDPAQDPLIQMGVG